jgi:hypothetical protein
MPVPRDAGLWIDEGALSFVTAMCYPQVEILNMNENMGEGE